MAELAPGTQFGAYRIESVAGQGGMGVVYRATQQGLDRTVALKVVAPQFAHDEEFRARFQREAKLAASIEHPNVIPVYEAGEHDGVLFLAMRYVDGTDVKTLLNREGRLEPIRAARFVNQIAAALDAAHAAGLVHRDVKPANALLAAQDHVYLTDFGLTKRAASGSAMTKTGQMVGTVDYVAPEQVEGTSVDARTDVYSLACVLYHLLTGKVPFDKPTEMAKLFAHVHEDPPRPSDAVPGLPGALDDVVWRGMAKDPSKRFLSAGDLGRAALAAAEHKPVAGPERSVARGEAAAEPVAHAPTVVDMPVAGVPDAATSLDRPIATATDASMGGTAAPAPPAGARKRNTKPWAIAAALVVIAGIAAALLTGGGKRGGGSSDAVPPGGEARVVSDAAPPKKGDEVLAAGETTVKGRYYRVVATRTKSKGGPRAPATLYFNEYMDSKTKLLHRFKVTDAKFYNDSVISTFKVEANPDPNPEKTAGIAFSWYHHVGDQENETQYYGVTSRGIEIY